MPAAERSSFLSRSCDGDAALRKEVDSLLSYEAVGHAAIDGSAMEAVGRAMALEQSHSWVGRQVSHYQVLASLGAGGMGEVYRARDIRLRRDVAIKALPLAFATDGVRMRRFEEEARTVGQLKHPNVVVVYDIGVHHGAPFIVTEMLEGEDLRQQLNRGALPQRRVIDYAQQIACGLAATHARGIVHRDLKPENLFVTREGCVKILDFGLAKLTCAADAEPSASTEPLESSPGFIVGTIGYLAPEQLRCERTDHRADLFAFGVIVHEMLSGQRPFERPSSREIVAAILEDDPPDLNGATGQITLNKIVRRCLEKDPEQRFQSARDLGFALDMLSPTSPESAEVDAPPSTSFRRGGMLRMRRWVASGAVLLTSLLTAAIGGMAIWSAQSVQRPQGQVARFVLPVQDGVVLPGDLELSRDGTFLAYSSGRGARTLFVRKLATPDAAPIAVIEGGEGPFFSPDSQWLGFFADGKMKKISMGGGAAITLADAPSQRGADWGEDGSIVFAPIARAGLFLVSEDGGVPEALTIPDEQRLETSHVSPRWLPGGRHVIYVARGETQGNRAIVAFSLHDHRSRVLLDGDAVPRYLRTGHLTFIRQGALMAVPFSAERLQLTGPAAAAVHGVAAYGVSDTGLLMYASSVNAAPGTRLVWVNRQGQTAETTAPVRNYGNPRLSPDGRRVAVAVATAGQTNIWIFDFVRDALVRLTFEGRSGWPVWLRDGREIVYASNRSGTSWDVYRRSTDGTGVEASVLMKPMLQIPHAVSDGGLLALTEIGPSSFHTAMLSMRDGALNVKVRNAWTPSLSPDGRWFAYTSNDAGRYDVYVRPTSGAEGQWQISTDGGVEPVWSASGSEIFYRHRDQMFAVDIVTNPTFEHGKPRKLFEGRYALGEVKDDTRAYDVAPDGQRFLMLKPESEPSTGDLKVVVNWYDELQRLGLARR